MTGDFWTGFWSGLILAAIIGFLAVLAGPFVRRMRSPFQPQIIIHKTSKTPCRVVVEAFAAFLITFLITLAIAAIFVHLFR